VTLDERQLAETLAVAFSQPTVDLETLAPDPPALALVPVAFARRFGLFPFACREQQLWIALSDPVETDGIDTLVYLTGLEVIARYASIESIRAAIDRSYKPAAASQTPSSPMDDFAEIATESPSVKGDADATASDAPIISLVQEIIAEAIRGRASDIHIEPLRQRLRVRYRVDGVLLEAESPPKRLQPAIISRLKIMADISIAEKRVPQDGRMQVNVAGRRFDLRVSALPTSHGQSIVMRILDQESLHLGLSDLGFFEDDRHALERLIELPDGIVLVTGPTGSGKTTTLYSCLHYLNQTDRKIITVEDPVEYQLSGINQVAVRPEIGVTFASALRAMLRQAPNVVMVGEIRDVETADVALQASLTGHTVFSTLHTNDAPGAITRLIDLGAKPFLVAASLRAVLAQRLVRTICPSCQRSHQPAPHELREIGFTPSQLASAIFRKGAGCATCRGTGYRGRIGICELLVINDELRSMIHANAGTARLRAKARSLGMRTMREDGARKITAGLTTIEEVVSITLGDPR
jgi:type IV pilus assembly protein PilB